MKNLNKLKKYEERVERIVEDPAKIIQIIVRINQMAGKDLDGKWIVTPPLPKEQKVTFFEFVKYVGNYQTERAEENGWDVQKRKEEIIVMEKRIQSIDGFSDYTLPEGTIIKYK